MVSRYTASHLPRPYRFPVSSVFPHRGSSFGEQSQGYQHATPACVLGWQENAALQSAAGWYLRQTLPSAWTGCPCSRYPTAELRNQAACRFQTPLQLHTNSSLLVVPNACYWLVGTSCPSAVATGSTGMHVLMSTTQVSLRWGWRLQKLQVCPGPEAGPIHPCLAPLPAAAWISAAATGSSSSSHSNRG
jgi:hypothetical protein